MVVLLEDSPISTEEFWSSVRVTIRFLLTSLIKEGRSPQTAQFGQAANSRKRLSGSKLLPFKNYGGHCVLKPFNAAELFWYPSPDLCLDTTLSRSSTDNSFDLMAWFLL